MLWLDSKQGEGGHLRESRKREDLRLHAMLRKKTSGLKLYFSSPRMSYFSEESLEILLLASDVGYLLRDPGNPTGYLLAPLVHSVLAHALTRLSVRGVRGVLFCPIGIWGPEFQLLLRFLRSLGMGKPSVWCFQATAGWLTGRPFKSLYRAWEEIEEYRQEHPSKAKNGTWGLAEFQ